MDKRLYKEITAGFLMALKNDAYLLTREQIGEFAEIGETQEAGIVAAYYCGLRHGKNYRLTSRKKKAAEEWHSAQQRRRATIACSSCPGPQDNHAG